MAILLLLFLFAATAYMPPEFTAFFSWGSATFRVAPLSDGLGEQPLPVILATPDRCFAVMGTLDALAAAQLRAKIM
jgi:hypothetical protein